jgi:hypothetical protein
MHLRVVQGEPRRWRIEIFDEGDEEYRFLHEMDDDILSLADSLLQRGSSASDVREAFAPYRDYWPDTLAEWLDADDEEVESLPLFLVQNDRRTPSQIEFERDALRLELPGVGYVDEVTLGPASGVEWVVVQGRANLERLTKALEGRYEFVWR